MRTHISRKEIRNDFVRKVEELSGQNLLVCYQCGKCSAGCPQAGQMDILPNQVIRLAQLGQKEDLVGSKTIWICASCLTCNVRCPKGVKIAEVMEAVRQVVLRKRQDHLHIEKLTDEQLESLPPIALIASFRKSTS
jgi:heterodisulfide reductase subunit C